MPDFDQASFWTQHLENRRQADELRRSLWDADRLIQPPAQSHSPTSLEAGSRIAPLTPSYRERVLQYITERPGVTDEEIAAGTGLNPSTARPRRVELERQGLIVADTQHGITRAGRKATRWRLA